MIVNTPSQKIENLNDFQTKAFEFNRTPEAFSAIIKNIYSNPVRSVIAELSQNAYDSMKEAGKEPSDFHIYIPTHVDPFFKVVDFGTGLSPEFMMNEYTLTFLSTKKNNVSVGGFGCGRLSALSLASNYSVTSRYKGKKYFYSVFLNEEGSPQIALIGAEDTTEENGVEVSVQIEKDDIDSFSDRVKEIFRYWSKKPTIKNDDFQFDEIEKECVGENWFLEKVYYGNSRHINSFAQVICGIYTYPIRQNGADFTSEELRVLKTNVVFTVNIGEVTPQLNRQELNYDATTVATLKRILQDLIAAVKKDFINETKECQNIFEAKIVYQKFSNGAFASLFKNLNVEWNGQAIDTNSYLINENDAFRCAELSISHGRVSERWRRTSRYITLRDKNKIYLTYRSEKTGEFQEQKRKIAKHGGKISFYADVLIFDSKSGKDEFCAKNVPNKNSPRNIFVDVDDLPPAPIERSAITYRGPRIHHPCSYRRILKYVGGGGRTIGWWAPVDIDTKTTAGIYVSIVDYRPVYNGKTLYNFPTHIDALKSLGLWKDDTILIGLKPTSKSQDFFKKSKNWISFDDYVKKSVKKIKVTNAEKIDAFLTNKYYQDRFAYDHFLSKTDSVISVLKKSHPIVKVSEELKKVKSVYDNYQKPQKIVTLQKLGVEPDMQKFNNGRPVSIKSDFKRKMCEIQDNYPIMFSVPEADAFPNIEKHIFGYIYGIDLLRRKNLTSTSKIQN